jgi:repressor LexA
MSLTPRQKEILEFIARFLERRGYAPSLKEIGLEFGLSSPATVHKHLLALESRGRIRRRRGRRRFLELVPPDSPPAGVELPLMGNVAAGRPIEAAGARETLTVPAFMSGRGKSCVLKVAGDSLLDEQIRDGDYIVLEERSDAANGEMVVALLEGGEATVRRIYRERGKVRLQPANPGAAPRVLPARSVRVRGVVKGLLRRY